MEKSKKPGAERTELARDLAVETVNFFDRHDLSENDAMMVLAISTATVAKSMLALSHSSAKMKSAFIVAFSGLMSS